MSNDLIENALKTKNPKDVVAAFLANSSKDSVQNAAEKLVAEDAIYMSLSFENKEQFYIFETINRKHYGNNNDNSNLQTARKNHQSIA